MGNGSPGARPSVASALSWQDCLPYYLGLFEEVGFHPHNNVARTRRLFGIVGQFNHIGRFAEPSQDKLFGFPRSS